MGMGALALLGAVMGIGAILAGGAGVLVWRGKW